MSCKVDVKLVLPECNGALMGRVLYKAQRILHDDAKAGGCGASKARAVPGFAAAYIGLQQRHTTDTVMAACMEWQAHPRGYTDKHEPCGQ